jgi:hypothetical protein
MRIRPVLFVLAPMVLACGGRTELSDLGDDFDSSMSEDAQDGSSNDGNVADAPQADSPAFDVVEIDVEPPPPPPPPPMCTSDCTHNAECESTCPPLTMGRYCCDLLTGTCYATPHHHCPIVILDAGFD